MRKIAGTPNFNIQHPFITSSLSPSNELIVENDVKPRSEDEILKRITRMNLASCSEAKLRITPILECNLPYQDLNPSSQGDQAKIAVYFFTVS